METKVMNDGEMPTATTIIDCVNDTMRAKQHVNQPGKNILSGFFMQIVWYTLRLLVISYIFIQNQLPFSVKTKYNKIN